VLKIKKKIKSIVLLSVFLLSCFSPMLVLGDPKLKPNYSWQETTYHYTLHRDWTGDSSVINYSSTYSDVFNTNLYYFNESEQTWTREVRTNSYNGNYSFFSNKTTKGYIDVDMNLDVYRVDIQYGVAVDLVWMALKQGTLEMDYFIDQYENDYSLFEEYNVDIESEFTKYNTTTSEIIDVWFETSNDTGVHNMTYDGDLIDYNSNYAYDMEFSLPIILTMQLYTTQNRDKIGWAEMIYDFIIYKDRDKDSIYSAGETATPPTSGFHLYNSDEMCGIIRPMAWDYRAYEEYNYPAPSNFTYHRIYPFDKTVDEIASTIQFTPPTVSAEDIITWEVKYPQFPIYASIIDADKPSERYSTPSNATYSQMSPGDFNYQFDYNLSENRADLDFTLSLPKISDEALYNATQGYGLSLPHYNFFIASFDINEVDPVELTMPSDLFTFESNGSTVAEINMINPVKKNYTLYDYPELGINTELESAGGSLHKILMMDSEQSANTGNPFINLIYTIKDFAEADPTFTIVDDLYHLETQNYPVWNGEKLVHDPTFTIYYGDPGTGTGENMSDPLIPGFDLFIVVALVSAIVVVQAVILKTWVNANKNRIKN